jgi:sulfofructose kinase
MMPDIMGLGYVCIDLLGIVPRIPGIDESVPMLETSRQQGGLTATALVAAARLGASVGFAGAVGDDEFGKLCLQIFENEGVDASQTVIVPGGTTAFSFVLIDEKTGKRTIISYGGSYWQSNTVVNVPDLTGVKFLHVDGAWGRTTVNAARLARERGIIVTLDPSSGNYSDDMIELLKLTDYAIPPYEFGKDLTGLSDPMAAARKLLDYGPKAVTITCGEHGSFTATREESFETPAFKVKAVDTTGAGDAFHGAFVVGLSRGYDLQTTAMFASAVAALKCTRIGGQAGLPTSQEVSRFLSERGLTLP